MSFMGVDVGTTGCKAAVFNAAGGQIAFAYRGYALRHPQRGFAELDAGEVIAAARDAVGDAASAAAAGSTLHAGDAVQTIGFSSQGEAFTPIAGDGRPLAGAMVSFDNRAAGEVTSFCQRFGRDRLYAITGHTPHAMFSLFKLLWLREHQPSVWRQAAKFLCFEDLMHHAMGLNPVIGWSLAARTMLFDVQQHRWSDAILDAAGIDASQLATPVPSGSVVGKLSESGAATVAAEWGLPANVIVVAGGHDQPCGALGAGAVQPGSAAYGHGTVDCITPVFDKPAFSDALRDGNLCTYDHAMPGLCATVAFSLTGGNMLTWFRDLCRRPETNDAASAGDGTDDTGDRYDLLLQHMIDEPSDLLVLPHFTSTGTPWFDPAGRGAILGLQLTTTRSQLLRGLLEGVALEMRLNLELLAGAGVIVHDLRAIGGGSRSRKWMQLKADVLNCPMTTVAVEEAGCLGVAMLGCSAATHANLHDLASAWVTPTHRIDPNPQHVQRYDAHFQKYRGLYAALKPFRMS